jgi:biopolymer transport protein ExbD
MRFYVRQKRRPPAIIIVALIDILIVLLIFLMVTTTFKQQPALKLALPESSQAVKTGANENAPLVISIDSQGSLRLGTDARPVTVDRLKEELLAAVAKNPELRLAISADKTAPWGQVVRVMDAAKEAKVKTGMVNAFMREAAK